MAKRRGFAWKAWLASIVLAGICAFGGLLFGAVFPFNYLGEPAFKILPYFPKSILRNFALALSLVPVVNFFVYLVAFRLFFVVIARIVGGRKA
jgi:hypothetical protein